MTNETVGEMPSVMLLEDDAASTVRRRMRADHQRAPENSINDDQVVWQFVAFVGAWREMLCQDNARLGDRAFETGERFAHRDLARQRIDDLLPGFSWGEVVNAIIGNDFGVVFERRYVDQNTGSALGRVHTLGEELLDS